LRFGVRRTRGSTFGIDGVSRRGGNDYKSFVKEHQDEVEEISEEAFWKSDVQILVPAAKQGTVTPEVARFIKKQGSVRLIVEGANGPLTKEAWELLEAREDLVTYSLNVLKFAAMFFLDLMREGRSEAVKKFKASFQSFNNLIVIVPDVFGQCRRRNLFEK